MSIHITVNLQKFAVLGSTKSFLYKGDSVNTFIQSFTLESDPDGTFICKVPSDPDSTFIHKVLSDPKS